MTNLAFDKTYSGSAAENYAKYFVPAIGALDQPTNAPVLHHQLGLTHAERQGYLFVRRLKCMDCHMINGRGKALGPDLSGVGYRLHEDYMREWIKDPASFNQETLMPAVPMTESQLTQIVAYLKTLQTKPEQ